VSLTTSEKVAFGVVGIPALMVVGTLWFGYVLSTVWGWYVVPLGAPSINWAAASGLSGVVGMFRMGTSLGQSKEGETVRDAVKKVVSHWLAYAFVLGIGRVTLYFAEWGPR
jgi:hypothetical protein